MEPVRRKSSIKAVGKNFLMIPFDSFYATLSSNWFHFRRKSSIKAVGKNFLMIPFVIELSSLLGHHVDSINETNISKFRTSDTNVLNKDDSLF